jgi:hypothetical protein
MAIILIYMMIVWTISTTCFAMCQDAKVRKGRFETPLSSYLPGVSSKIFCSGEYLFCLMSYHQKLGELLVGEFSQFDGIGGFIIIHRR